MQSYEKVINTTVNILNPFNFCASTDSHLLGLLRDLYNGRCFMGAFILNVKSITTRSACHIEKTSNTNNGYIHVRFLADVSVFSRWDIITNVVIVSRQQMLVGVYEKAGGPRAVVSLLASKAVEALAVGQKIAVRVVLAQHMPMQPEVSIVATLLTCDQAAPIYQLRGVLGADARIELAPMLAAVERELEARAKLPREPLWFFERLLYAFREEPGASAPGASASAPGASAPGAPAWTGPPAFEPPDQGGIELVNVVDIVRAVVAGGENVSVTGSWSRLLHIYRSSPFAARAARAPASWAPDGAPRPISAEPRAVFAELLKNILDYLTATRELVEVYDSRDAISKHLNVWSIMRAAQRPSTAHV